MVVDNLLANALIISTMLPTEHNDPINARILAISEDKIEGFMREPFEEIASGCARYHAAWILNLAAFGAGLVIAPNRLFRAFLRGRHAKTNLYKNGFDESRLDEVTVGMLRDHLGLDVPLSSARPTDVALFTLWCVPSILPWLPVPLVTAILFWLIVRWKFRTP